MLFPHSDKSKHRSSAEFRSQNNCQTVLLGWNVYGFSSSVRDLSFEYYPCSSKKYRGLPADTFHTTLSGPDPGSPREYCVLDSHKYTGSRLHLAKCTSFLRHVPQHLGCPPWLSFGNSPSAKGHQLWQSLQEWASVPFPSHHDEEASWGSSKSAYVFLPLFHP